MSVALARVRKKQGRRQVGWHTSSVRRFCFPGVAVLALLVASCTPATHHRSSTASHTSGIRTASSPNQKPTRTGAPLWTPDSVVIASRRVAYVLAGHNPADPPAALFATTDQGRHFEPRTLPRARHRGRRLFVAQMLFVDAKHGYALLGHGGPQATQVLALTVDGAQTWHVAHLPGSDGARVAAVAGHGGRVFAATVACRGVTRCSTVHLYTARIGRAWQQTEAAIPPRDSSSGLTLAAWDSSVWLLVGVGSTHDPLLLWSNDAGRNFTSQPAPRAVTCSAAATSARVMWTSCATGMLMTFARTVTSHHPQQLTLSGAGTTNTYLDPLTDRTAYFQTSAGRDRGLRRTRNAGRTFQDVAIVPGAAGSAGWGVHVTFFDAHVGLCVLVGRGLLRTQDSGHTWHHTAPLKMAS